MSSAISKLELKENETLFIVHDSVSSTQVKRILEIFNLKYCSCKPKNIFLFLAEKYPEIETSCRW